MPTFDVILLVIALVITIGFILYLFYCNPPPNKALIMLLTALCLYALLAMIHLTLQDSITSPIAFGLS